MQAAQSMMQMDSMAMAINAGMVMIISPPAIPVRVDQITLVNPDQECLVNPGCYCWQPGTTQPEWQVEEVVGHIAGQLCLEISIELLIWLSDESDLTTAQAPCFS